MKDKKRKQESELKPAIEGPVTLGVEARDLVTGAQGIVTSMVVYLNGCVQFCIHPPVVNGIKHESYYIDENQLVKVGEGVVEEMSKALQAKEPTRKPGGPPPITRPSFDTPDDRRAYPPDLD